MADTDKEIGLPPKLRETLKGLNAQELGVLNGVVAGTVSPGKTVVVNAQKRVDELGVDSLDVSALSFDGTPVTPASLSTHEELEVVTLKLGSPPATVTATAEEINLLAGVEPGDLTPGKAFVLPTTFGGLVPFGVPATIVALPATIADVSDVVPTIQFLVDQIKEFKIGFEA